MWNIFLQIKKSPAPFIKGGTVGKRSIQMKRLSKTQTKNYEARLLSIDEETKKLSARSREVNPDSYEFIELSGKIKKLKAERRGILNTLGANMNLQILKA
jgi:hypothetical protein